MKTLLTTLVLCLMAVMVARAQYGPVGFVNCADDAQDGITGGMGGSVVRVTTREQLAHYASLPEPYTIIVDARLEGSGLRRQRDVIDVASDKTIVGVCGAELAGIGLNISGQHNIIVRNLVIHHADPDAIAARRSHHIWVDHCEVYSEDEPKREDWDGLIDLTSASSYLTVSYCFLHDHHKACLLNSGTMHDEDNGRNRATYHHNAFLRIDQRCPRIGYGLGHVFCNYYQDIGSYAIGFHTQARVCSEHNYFADGVRRPFLQMYATSLDEASCAFLTDRDSHFTQPLPDGFRHRPTGHSFCPSSWYDSNFALDDTASVATIYPLQTGPVDGLEHEPILWPGNGAIDVPTTITLRHSEIEGMTRAEMLLGTSPDRLRPVSPDTLTLRPATTYYWQVAAVNIAGRHTSPLYRFTTAAARATRPQPADGERRAPLRAAADSTTVPSPLCWHRAAEAAVYRVFLSTDSARLDSHPLAVTPTTTCTPPPLRCATTYYWRVDTQRADGTVVTGDVWSFTTPTAPVTVGRTEAEHLARSAYAYVERPDSTWFVASNDSVTVGEAGPGALSGVWQGPDGRYTVAVTFYDEQSGRARMSLYVNDIMVDKWQGDKTAGLTTHTVPHTVSLRHGDQLRLDFCTQGKMRCRIDCIDIIP